MSRAQPSWSPVESTDRPITFTFLRSNSGLIFAMYPSSVVHTGVKSFGCEKSTAHESPIQSWKWIFPSVVSASKSGAVSPICRLIRSPFLLKVKRLYSLLRRVSMSTFTLVQPRVRRREWQLRRGAEVRAVLRLSTFRARAEAEAAGRPLQIEQRGWWRPEYVVRNARTDEEVARLRRNELELGQKTLRWKRLGRKGGSGFVDGKRRAA